MYSLLLAVIYLTFISLGLPDSLLGSAWTTMQTEWGVPISYMGIVSMVISGGTILSSLMSERLTKGFGTKYVTLFSIVLTALALYGFSAAHFFWQLVLWAVPYGLGAGTIDSALNNYVAIHYNSRHMSWLHCFWGVGTIISPYVMSYCLTHHTWHQGYRTISLLQAGIAVVFALTLPLWKVNQPSVQGEKGKKPLGLIGTIQIEGVVYVLLAFMAYCSAEATAMLWASSYFVNAKGISPQQAAAYGSLFFIGITAGRFLAGFISNRVGDHKMIRLGVGIAMLGLLLILLPVPSVYMSLAGFLTVGLGCAPIYPSIIHSTPQHFGQERSQAIIGIQMASAYVGSTFMPPVFGLIANAGLIKVLPIYVLFFFILLLIMIEKVFSGEAAQSVQG